MEDTVEDRDDFEECEDEDFEEREEVSIAHFNNTVNHLVNKVSKSRSRRKLAKASRRKNRK